MSRSEKRKAEESVAFRLNPEMYAVAADKAARHGLSVGQYARALVVKDAGHVLPVLRRGPPRDAAVLRGLTAQLGKIGSNVNQLARTTSIDLRPAQAGPAPVPLP